MICEECNQILINPSGAGDGLSGFGINAMPADALAPKVVDAPAGVVLTLKRLLFWTCIEDRNGPFKLGNILMQFSQWKT